jgi:hypothetical protein
VPVKASGGCCREEPGGVDVEAAPNPVRPLVQSGAERCRGHAGGDRLGFPGNGIEEADRRQEEVGQSGPQAVTVVGNRKEDVE